MRARERGSICLYVCVCMIAMALLFGAMVPLAANVMNKSTRRIDELKARLAFEAGVAMVKSRSLTMTLTLGSPISVSLDGVSGTVTPTSNDGQLAGSLLVNGTITRNGRSYRFSRVIGARTPNPWQFALFSDANLKLKQLIAGQSAKNGDIWSNGNVTVTQAGSAVNGNIVAGGSITAAGVTVTGNKYTNYDKFDFANSLALANYLTENTAMTLLGIGNLYLLGATMNSLTLPSPVNGNYSMTYVTGNLTIKGTMSGKGTVYVTGDMTINGDLRYLSSSDRVAFIIAGNLKVGPGVGTIDGIFGVGKAFTITDPSLTVSRGMIAAKSIENDINLSLMRDDAVINDTAEGIRLRLPYYWP